MNQKNLAKIPYKEGRIWFNRGLVSKKEYTELDWLREELDI
jgi:hypothetical protein